MVAAVTGFHFPPGACDTHVHFYDCRYASAPGALLRPPDAPPAMYRVLRAELGLERVVVVQPTTYGLDNTCQLDAAAEFGADARLVVVVDEHVSDAELDRLARRGARGARFHLLPGGAVTWSSMPAVAGRIAERGWHVQLQLNGRELPEHIDRLLALPCPLVVDHVGRYMPPVAPDHPAFQALLRLIDTGRCWVKLSAPYESSADRARGFPAVTLLAETLLGRAPERMLWASNWPHPGQPDPLTTADLAALAGRWLPTETLRRTVLVDNPTELYGFAPVAPADAPIDTRTTHQETST
jgi:D-galactarolactone isomerase